MGLLGKVLGGAAIGVGAVALAPFTGGGSVAAGATLIGSLTGAGAIATGAATAGITAGKMMHEAEEARKEEQIKRAKEASFQDGVYEGMSKSDEEIDRLREYEKIHSYIIGATMFAYYVAKVDGEISEEEQLEIDHDLNAFVDNHELPKEVLNKLHEISQMDKIVFSDVRVYLDNISVETLAKFDTDLEEIIQADGIIHPQEEKAQAIWRKYYESRKKA
jgi:uncharacterized membrane protein YebE (DUF533 family)